MGGWVGGLGGWVEAVGGYGGWVGVRWVEENEAVGMNYCELGEGG